MKDCKKPSRGTTLLASDTAKHVARSPIRHNHPSRHLRESSVCYSLQKNHTNLDRSIASPPSSQHSKRLDCRKSFSSTIPNIFCGWLFILILSSVFFLQVDASALTTNIIAGERLCFYAWVDKLHEKVGFYFAVQSGGAFDIDWTITDPHDTIVIEGEKERQGDYIFTANAVGEYSFCFHNDISSFSEKFVDFDIMVENEPRPVAPAKPTSITEQTSSLEDSIYKLSGSLSNIQRTQKYFRTRENRNVSTVKDTRDRIVSHSLWAFDLIL
ncbi:emp24/gp25L/p24 family/GOLD-domain-containing protein [Melampsora americana]|nr:emp24/gp25L/p24 family/GOLD-domain-containing protein [Melampsora americana]